MPDYIEAIIVGVVAGTVVVAISGLWNRRHWIAWHWRRFRDSRDRRRAEREQYLNQPVLLTTGEMIHRGCADSKDKIKSELIIPAGRCMRCGEHGGNPRASM